MPELIQSGIVGYGFGTRTFHAPLVAAASGLRLAAIATSNPSRCQADWPDVEVEASPEALFARPDLDLVVIATPNHTHHRLALAALGAGKHVVVDKPFTVTSEEGIELLAEAEGRGRLLSGFHNRRWDADYLTLRHLIEAGELGRVVHFESHFDRYSPHVRARWREEPGPGSGLWYDLGPHLLDQALVLFGPPEAIALDLAGQRDGARIDDYFHAQLRYRQLRVILHASTLVPAPGPRFTVHGTMGSFVKQGLDGQESALLQGRSPAEPGWGIDSVPATVTRRLPSGEPQESSLPCLPGDYPSYYRQIAEAIGGRGPNPVPAAEAIQVVRLLELGCRSSAERRELPVEPLTEP